MSEASKTYRVLFEAPAWDEIMALPTKIQERILGATERLEQAPRPSGVVKLHGPDDLYRVRVGDYRIIYQIQDAVLVVIVVKAGKRGSVYQRR